MIRDIWRDHEICPVAGIIVQLPSSATSWASTSCRSASTREVTSATSTNSPTTSPSTTSGA
jgi:hypothetical protein